MFLYAATIFVSAFLLFLVQPIIAKQVLPWFGGAAAVWTTCLVFFQATLLAGYAYSDLAVHRLRPRVQIGAHIGLLALSLVLLPIIPASGWKPTGLENPSWRILALLAVTIGLPYFLLSTTSPLMQAWLARSRPGSSPYRLFALSNLASLVALVGYPFLLEPWVSTRVQALSWSAGYVVFALLCAWTGRVSLGPVRRPQIEAVGQPDGIGTEIPPTVARQVLWATLAGTASLLLLAVSNHIVQNIAAVPLLWIIPLAIYLLTFILCFDTRGWYRRELFLAMFAAGVSVMGWTLADSRLTFDLDLQIVVFCAGLFLACMFCHGELVRLKPAPRYLTRFYLMVSLGGAAGSALVGIVAPLVLPADFELAGGLVVAALLLGWQARRDHLVFVALALAAVFATISCAVWSINEFYDRTLVASRNFYGVLRVQLNGQSDSTYRRSLVHGTILHGLQYLAPELRRTPTSYYTSTSGIGRLFESLHPSLTPLKVGIIGLGAGTLAAWGAKGDVFRFYEINPAVLDIARRDFSYLQDSDATIEVVIGDARLSLEREPSQQFDVLIVDAFSSDAIPVHLITAQALGIYRRHMKPGGVIAFHVTNRYLNLPPVLEALARAQGMHAIQIADSPTGPASSSDWILLSDQAESLRKPDLVDAAKDVEVREDWRLWTDDFNNLVQVLK
jgi:SAM-dependent methyltransferase